ncbi:MAG: Hydrogenase expression/formation protein HypD [candidate division BRC1 bacterium ADurb.BinA364]|nr:MAG: Hydrogenase expression/formation protein HypD [candidate division BRC1 bacterium ADurb.BinA364]
MPGRGSSLEQERAAGADVRVVYSPLDALHWAEKEPEREFVFAAVGFETTAPATAAALMRASGQGLRNFSALALHKRIPPAMEAVLDGARRLDGFLAPGHVSVVIGANAYEELALRHNAPCVATGFEPEDIVEGIAMLAGMIAEGRSESLIQYRRAVRPEGNPRALAAMERVFEPCDSQWRGLGILPASGLRLREDWRGWEAAERFDLPAVAAQDPPGCLCGQVLKGLIDPPRCPLFGGACNPRHPVGPCMVSCEGACAARYEYGE